MINLYNMDCMEAMSKAPNNHWDLAIVDPPYGIGMGRGAGITRGGKKADLYTPKQWDSAKPNKEYFLELFRTSKNQIIWGANYFSDMLPPSRGWIYWEKLMGGNYADGELAFTSFDTNLKQFTKRSDSGGRIHPTQKPVALYTWILDRYAKPEIESSIHILGVGPLRWLVMIWDSTWMGLRLTKNISKQHPNDSRTIKDS